MAIDCCNGCVPPERNAWCHGYCKKYIEQKAKHEAEKAEADKQRHIGGDIYAQRSKRVYQAIKKQRKGGFHDC
jgi:hypothetical protein